MMSTISVSLHGSTVIPKLPQALTHIINVLEKCTVTIMVVIVRSESLSCVCAHVYTHISVSDMSLPYWCQALGPKQS
jgi:hypothetical protein